MSESKKRTSIFLLNLLVVLAGISIVFFACKGDGVGVTSAGRFDAPMYCQHVDSLHEACCDASEFGSECFCDPSDPKSDCYDYCGIKDTTFAACGGDTTRVCMVNDPTIKGCENPCTIDFKTDIHPIFTANGMCTDCHNSTSREGDLDLSTWKNAYHDLVVVDTVFFEARKSRLPNLKRVVRAYPDSSLMTMIMKTNNQLLSRDANLKNIYLMGYKTAMPSGKLSVFNWPDTLMFQQWITEGARKACSK
ncbi:MAG: hypothetical protein HQK83_16785 [Fibrobacteria bacterium]|nr:hypothetical protein [Fibrobacteria bacterium]